MVTEMPVISPGEPPTSCAGCGGHIADRYYLQAVDRQWHGSCLTCHSCKAQLDNELTCFYKDGHIYCKEDYYRLFPVRRCSRCQLGIYASELVMRARDLVFHLHCFTCTWCNAPLAQGDTFGLRDDLVYCRPHYETLARDAAAYFSPPPPHLTPQAHGETHHPPEGGAMPVGHCLSAALPYQPSPPLPTGRKGRPRKKRNGEMTGADAVGRHGAGLSIDPSCNIHLTHLDGPHPPSQSSPPLTSGQRTKRMRTSFKHHQLRTMKSYFAINQNPDAKDLKQLAQKTGLSKRVLQVWFQNARAKWRRNNMKQQDSMSGIISNDQPSTPQLHQSGGHIGPGMCSPGSSYSEASPVHSCGGPPSDGSMSTQVPGGPMDFDSSNPMTPLVNHYGLNPIHNGEQDMRITSFHELF